MALMRHTFLVQDGKGNIKPGATITVKEHIEGTPLAAVYADEAGEVPLANGGFYSDSKGKVTFCVIGGFYDITVDLGGDSDTIENVGIGTTQGYDVTQVLALAATGALTPRGAYDEVETYSLYDLVTYQKSSWIYTAEDPSDGNAPPTLPDVQNEHWLLVAERGESGEGLRYDAMGAYSERDTHTDEEAGFAFLSLDGDQGVSPTVDTAVIFVLETPGSPFEWSEAIPVQGPAGPQGASAGFKLSFSTSVVDGDPGAGAWRFDNADLDIVEFLYVSDHAMSGADISAWLQTLVAGDELHLTNIQNQGIEGRFAITGDPVDAAGYTKVPVEKIAAAGVFAGADVFVLGVSFVGAEGAVDTVDFVTPDETNTLNVGYTHQGHDHGEKAGGAQSITPLPSLGQKQKVTMAASCALTITPPAAEVGDCVLRIINGGITSSLNLSGFGKIFNGDAYSTASGKKFNLYIESYDGVTTCLLKAVN